MVRTRATPYHKTLAMERALPGVLDGELTTETFAKASRVHIATASLFLADKAEKYALENKRKFFAFSSADGIIFNDAARRQMDVLASLNGRPFTSWDAEDRKLERHALACLKALHPFLILCAQVAKTTLAPLPGTPGAQDDSQLLDDESPDDYGESSGTLADGL